MSIFDPSQGKKNVRGRATLSDGVSKMICMIPEKIAAQMVSAKGRAPPTAS